MCNQYSFYLLDADFGPLFIKFSSYYLTGLAVARATGCDGIDRIPEKMGRVLGRLAHVFTASSLLGYL